MSTEAEAEDEDDDHAPDREEQRPTFR